jgi:hypothetical protein
MRPLSPMVDSTQQIKLQWEYMSIVSEKDSQFLQIENGWMRSEPQLLERAVHMQFGAAALDHLPVVFKRPNQQPVASIRAHHRYILGGNRHIKQ